MSLKKEHKIPSEGENKIDLFQKNEVRKVHHDGEWWFALTDVVKALTDSSDPAQYLKRVRTRDSELALLFNPVDKGGVQIVPPLMLPLETAGGMQDTQCWNIEGIFRLVQSIPSKKAEPFKKWLAKVGFERLQEIENPDLAIKRAFALYKSKGYDDEWIETRINNKASRLALTSAWKEHGMNKPYHIAVLTDAVSIEALGIRTAAHKELKGLTKSQDLRDHMTPLELTLTTLGEQATTEIVNAKKPTTLSEHKDAATEGGTIAGTARKQIENATGKSVISNTNFLTDRQKENNAKKRLEAQKNIDDEPDVDTVAIVAT